MGEYIRLNGDAVKLGTCEDLYYCTFEQLCTFIDAMKKEPHNCDPSDYLKESGGWRYRFPFPDEDEIPIGTHDNFDRGHLVELPEENPIELEKVQHRQIRADITNARGAKPLSMCCPFSKEFDGIGVKYNGQKAIEIVQQKQVEGDLWTVCRCPLCDAKFRLPPSEGLWLADYVSKLSTGDDELTTEIARRIRNGYGVREYEQDEGNEIRAV